MTGEIVRSDVSTCRAVTKYYENIKIAFIDVILVGHEINCVFFIDKNRTRSFGLFKVY